MALRQNRSPWMYRVADESVGDQVRAAFVLDDGESLTEEFEKFLATSPDLSPEAWSRSVRINDALPHTATTKILKRELIRAGVSAEGWVLWQRVGRGTAYAAMSERPGSPTV